MNFNEFTSEEPIVEAQLVWARKGNKLARKFRCAVGQRAGRVVSNPSQCSAPIDIKKRMVLKRTKAKMGARMSRKASRTKKFNPASKALKRLNR
jgi:hypothetical protein